MRKPLNFREIFLKTFLALFVSAFCFAAWIDPGIAGKDPRSQNFVKVYVAPEGDGDESTTTGANKPEVVEMQVGNGTVNTEEAPRPIYKPKGPVSEL